MSTSNRDVRGILRGKCEGCTKCPSFLGSGDSKKCSCCHCPPGRHQRLEESSSNQNIQNEFSTLASVTTGSSDLWYGSSSYRQDLQHEPMDVDTQLSSTLPLCINCTKSKVYFDTKYNFILEYCSPKCRDENLLQKEAEKLDKEIDALERISPIGNDFLSKYSLTQAEMAKLQSEGSFLSETKKERIPFPNTEAEPSSNQNISLASVNTRSSDLLYGSSSHRQHLQHEPMDVDTQLTSTLPLCINCLKSEVYFDTKYKFTFKYCSPKCRDENLLQKEAEKLKKEIDALERISPIGKDLLSKYSLTQAEIAKLQSEGNFLSEKKKERIPFPNTEAGHEVLAVVTVYSSDSIGVVLGETSVSTDQYTGFPVIGVKCKSVTFTEFVKDNIRIFDLVTKVNDKNLVKSSDLKDKTKVGVTRLRIIGRHVIPSMHDILKEVKKYPITHIFGLRSIDRDHTVGIHINITKSKVRVVWCREKSIGEHSGVLSGDYIHGFTSTKEKKKFNELTCCSHNPKKFKEELLNCFLNLGNTISVIILLIERL